MALAWLWILLAAALVLGPISYMMPTKRDRLLTRLRAQARLEGGLIDIDHLPKLDAEAHERVSAGGAARSPTLECARYKLPASKRLKAVPELELLLAPGGGWVRHPDDPRTPEDRLLELLQGSAQRLPPGTHAVAVRKRAVSMCWLERGDVDEATVSAIFAELKALASALEAAYPPPDDHGNS